MSENTIVLYNTLSGSKEKLETLEPGKCGIYCCGPTVYDLTHLGNARAAVVPDLLVRFLRHQGYEVKYVRNVTDIDDKIISRSQERGETPADMAVHFTREYHRDMTALNVVEPDVEPKVSETIPEIIELVQSLVDKGLAYDVDGDVYYRVTEFKGSASCRTVRWTRCSKLRAAASTWTSARKRPWTLPSGKPPNPASRAGPAPGVKAVPAGTSSARP